MPKYEAKQRFSLTVAYQGRNVYLQCADGDEIDLEADIAALVLNDLPNSLVLKAAKKPAEVISEAPAASEEPEAEPEAVESKPGPTPKAKTRAVAKKPGVKK